jgi:hypothetical protein
MPPPRNLKFIWTKTLWGCNEILGNCPSGYTRLFQRIKDDGFTAVETPIWKIEDKKLFAQALSATGLGYVAMINTCLPDKVGVYDLEEHIKSFNEQVGEALVLNPILINAHSGCDLWPFETSIEFFKHAISVEKDKNILICHETHRGRVLYNPWITRDICRALPSIHLTADLSHFVVVAERVFADSDKDWKSCLEVIASKTRHIHARVGYNQGPQVPDPRAPEYASAVESHERWWDSILEAQVEGSTITIEPEHGTDGYQQRLPFTQVETADLWAVNSYLRNRLENRWA